MTYVSEIPFNVTLSYKLKSPEWSLILKFSDIFFMFFLSPLWLFRRRHSHYSWYYVRINIWWVQTLGYLVTDRQNFSYPMSKLNHQQLALRRLHSIFCSQGETSFVNTESNTSQWWGRAIAEAVSRRLPTAAARAQSQVSSCEICGGQCSASGQVFSQYISFPYQLSFHQLLHIH
jgi:hypothetical protein